MRLLVLLTSVLLVHAPLAHGGFLTPTSIFPHPPLTPFTINGSPVTIGGQAGNAYSDLGVVFQNTALAMINGQIVWVPTTTPVPDGAPDGTLDFTPGYGGAVKMKFVEPGTNNPITTDFVQVELVGLPPAGPMVGAGGLLAYLDEDVSVISLDSVLLPNGNTLMTLSWPGMYGFDIYKQLTLETNPGPWGIASIEFGSPGNAETPEPGTLALTVVGLGALAWRQRLRRRRTARHAPA